MKIPLAPIVLSYDLEKEEEKFLLYKMLVAHSCDDCSSAPLTQYKNNPIYQEITMKIHLLIIPGTIVFVLIWEKVKAILMN